MLSTFGAPMLTEEMILFLEHLCYICFISYADKHTTGLKLLTLALVQLVGRSRF